MVFMIAVQIIVDGLCVVYSLLRRECVWQLYSHAQSGVNTIRKRNGLQRPTYLNRQQIIKRRKNDKDKYVTDEENI